MRGKIASGLGQGQYFLTREGYSRQFLEHLGFVPFPGTLNVRLEEPFPAELPAIRIEGFAEDEAVAAIRAGQTLVVGRRTPPRFFIGNTVQSIYSIVRKGVQRERKV